MKILFIPMNGFGHVNACIGLAKVLQKYGHECVFIVGTEWSAFVENQKFSVEPLSFEDNDQNGDPQDIICSHIAPFCDLFKLSPKEQIKIKSMALQDFTSFIMKIDEKVEQLILNLETDLIIIDFYVTLPSVVKSELPWILLFSANPLGAYDRPDVPPAHFGLGASDDPQQFTELRSAANDAIKEVKEKFDSWLISKEVLPEPQSVIKLSPYLNIYCYPSDLDYEEFGPLSESWFRVDHLVRDDDDSALGFDESFLENGDDANSKLILFSLGSMGSSDVDLMNKLVGFLSQAPHKFIVACGSFHESINLADNMVGGKYVNLVKTLPFVDLIIHHGGNNTLLESLYFGKPSIILPIFFDQHDNGRRIVDKGIGKTFNPYEVTGEELLKAIDDILCDEKLLTKVHEISEKMQNSETHEQLNEVLIEIVASFKSELEGEIEEADENGAEAVDEPEGQQKQQTPE